MEEIVEEYKDCLWAALLPEDRWRELERVSSIYQVTRTGHPQAAASMCYRVALTLVFFSFHFLVLHPLPHLLHLLRPSLLFLNSQLARLRAELQFGHRVGRRAHALDLVDAHVDA